MVGIDEAVAIVGPIITFALGIFLGRVYQKDKDKLLLLQKNEFDNYYRAMRDPDVMAEAQLRAGRMREAHDNGRKTMPREDAWPPAIVHRNQFRRARRRRYWSPPGF